MALVFKPPAPGVVEWDEDGLLYGSLDPTTVTNGLILSWYDNPFASGWKIERLSYRGLGAVTQVVSSGVIASGTGGYNFTVSGVHSAANLVTINGGLVGYVNEVTAGANSTVINVISDEELGSWVDKTFYVYKDTATIADVDRKDLIDLGETIQYIDTSVLESLPY